MRGACRTTWDYFIVSESLVGQVMKVTVQEGWPSAPRKPVGLTLDLRPQERRARMRVRPKPLDDRMIGCAPEPLRYAPLVSFNRKNFQAKAGRTHRRHASKIAKVYSRGRTIVYFPIQMQRQSVSTSDCRSSQSSLEIATIIEQTSGLA